MIFYNQFFKYKKQNLRKILQSYIDSKLRMKRFMDKIYRLSGLSIKNEVIESVYLFEQKLSKVLRLLKYYF